MDNILRMRRVQLTAHQFDFNKLVLAHGWVSLLPFTWDHERARLSRPLRLPTGHVLPFHISVNNSQERCVVTASTYVSSEMTSRDRRDVRRQIRRMLRLDEDFSAFQETCVGDPILGFVADFRCGGLLRCPSSFEDLIKTVCTTNCDWKSTKRMCAALCNLTNGTFPEPEQLHEFTPRQLAKTVPVGYRAKTIIQAAKLWSHGGFDLDDLANNGDFDGVRELLSSIKGVGPYCINHMLVLLGCYTDIPVDSQVMKCLCERHFGGQRVSTKEAVKPYQQYGKYRFLAFKFAGMSQRLGYGVANKQRPEDKEVMVS